MDRLDDENCIIYGARHVVSEGKIRQDDVPFAYPMKLYHYTDVRFSDGLRARTMFTQLETLDPRMASIGTGRPQPIRFRAECAFTEEELAQFDLRAGAARENSHIESLNLYEITCFTAIPSSKLVWSEMDTLE